MHPHDFHRSAFRPHAWLEAPLAQTIVGSLLRARVAADLRIERVETPDDDFIELGWHHEAAHGPIAVLVHGIGGHLRSGYMQAMAVALAELGWTSVALQLRGAGAEPNRQARMFHHADTGDFRRVCRRLHEQAPQRALVAIGWSLGGSIVLNALGEDQDSAPVSAAAVVSPPLRLPACAEFLRGPARLYQELMLNHVKRLVRRKQRAGLWPEHLDVDAILGARDFLEWCDVYTAPLCGYRSGREYCERADPGRQLARIRRPTLVVTARDDPLLGPAALPERAAAPPVRVEVTERGGHVGFVGTGRFGEPRSWLEPRVARFLRAAVHHRSRDTIARRRAA